MTKPPPIGRSDEAPTGDLVVTRTANPGGEPTLDYRWEGGDVVHISKDIVTEGDRRHVRLEGPALHVGPFELEVLGYNWATDAYVARRKQAIAEELPDGPG